MKNFKSFLILFFILFLFNNLYAEKIIFIFPPIIEDDANNSLLDKEQLKSIFNEAKNIFIKNFSLYSDNRTNIIFKNKLTENFLTNFELREKQYLRELCLSWNVNLIIVPFVESDKEKAEEFYYVRLNCFINAGNINDNFIFGPISLYYIEEIKEIFIEGFFDCINSYEPLKVNKLLKDIGLQ